MLQKFGIALISAIWAFACIVEGHAAVPARKVVIGHAALNARVAPLWIAEDHGFFSKYGVNASAIFIRQAPVLVAALTAGDVLAAIYRRHYGAHRRRRRRRSQDHRDPDEPVGLRRVAAPAIKTAKDLIGKKVGVQTLAGTVWMGAMLGLEHLGLDPQRDKITFLVIGDQTVRPRPGSRADRHDRARRRVQPQAASTGLQRSRRAVKSEHSVFIPRPGRARQHVQEQRESIEGIMKGLLEGIAFCLAPRNKPAVIATIMKRLKLNEPASAEEGYLDVINGVERKPLPGSRVC